MAAGRYESIISIISPIDIKTIYFICDPQHRLYMCTDIDYVCEYNN